jgi:hypothetical protein
MSDAAIIDKLSSLEFLDIKQNVTEKKEKERV